MTNTEQKTRLANELTDALENVIEAIETEGAFSFRPNVQPIVVACPELFQDKGLEWLRDADGVEELSEQSYSEFHIDIPELLNYNRDVEVCITEGFVEALEELSNDFGIDQALLVRY